MTHEVSRFNHFDAAPSSLHLVHPNQDPLQPPRFVETRSANNPDLGVFLCNLQESPEIARLRAEYEERLTADASLRQAFYEAIPPQDFHSTILRIGMLQELGPEAIEAFCQELGQHLRSVARPDLVIGEGLRFGDGIIFTIEPQEAEKGNPLAAVRHLSQAALRNVGIPVQSEGSGPVPHSTDRYARALTDDDRVRLRELFTSDPIEPAKFQPDAVYVAANWPERDDVANYGSYPHRTLAKISFDTGEVTLQ